MTKLQFLFSLKEKLSALPQEEVEERLRFYSEMIEDRMEEGLSEEEAVSAVGSVDEITAQILAEVPVAKAEQITQKPKKQRSGWVIALLILGSPLWLSLLMASFAVALSLFVSLWSVIVSFWAVFVSFVCTALACTVIGIIFAAGIHRLSGFALIGMGLLLAGVSIFLFFGCKAATKGAAFLTKKLTVGIFNSITKKEAVS